MAKSNRSKKELEQDLKEYAKQIYALNEFPEIRPKTKLEERLKMHSPRWNSIIREACADMFYFAKTLTYDNELYKTLGITRSNSLVSPVDELVSLFGETIMTVACRRFSSKELSEGDSFIEMEFINKLETDLRESIKTSVYSEKNKESTQGITGISKENIELVKKYYRFREDFIGFKRAAITEEKIQNIFIKTQYPAEKDPEKKLKKLKASILAYNQNYVQKETETLREDKDGNGSTAFDYVEDNREKQEKDFKRKLRINEIQTYRIINRMNLFFEKKLKRKNSDVEYWSVLLTHFILSMLERKLENKDRSDDFIKKLESQKFIYHELLEVFKKDGSVPPRKKMMEKLGKDEGKASSDTKIIINFLKDSF